MRHIHCFDKSGHLFTCSVIQNWEDEYHVLASVVWVLKAANELQRQTGRSAYVAPSSVRNNAGRSKESGGTSVCEGEGWWSLIPQTGPHQKASFITD